MPRRKQDCPKRMKCKFNSHYCWLNPLHPDSETKMFDGWMSGHGMLLCVQLFCFDGTNLILSHCEQQTRFESDRERRTALLIAIQMKSLYMFKRYRHSVSRIEWIDVIKGNRLLGSRPRTYLSLSSDALLLLPMSPLWRFFFSLWESGYNVDRWCNLSPGSTRQVIALVLSTMSIRPPIRIDEKISQQSKDINNYNR